MLQAGFIIITVLMAVLVYAAVADCVSKAIDDVNRQKQFKINILLIMSGWLVYISVLSKAGVFAVNSLPPRIPLLLVIPTFIFMAWFFLSAKFRPFIDAVPSGWLVYAQAFRVIVELLLVGLFYKGLLPKAATFEGYNFDVVIGISALLVGYFGYSKKVISPAIILLWNLAGLLTLAIVVFIIIGYAYFPSIWSQPEPFSLKDFAVFPYTFLAGFLMPVAVFMHVFSIVKTRQAMK